MGPKRQSVCIGHPFQPCVMQHSSLLGSFVSWEENKILFKPNQSTTHGHGYCNSGRPYSQTLAVQHKNATAYFVMKLTPTHIRSYLEQKARVFSAAKESKDKVRAYLSRGP
jgi:hypothetical protein